MAENTEEQRIIEEKNAVEQKMFDAVNTMRAEKLNRKNIEYFPPEPPEVWQIDWTKVETLDDLFAILSEMNIRFSGPITRFPNAEPYLKKV